MVYSLQHRVAEFERGRRHSGVQPWVRQRQRQLRPIRQRLGATLEQRHARPAREPPAVRDPLDLAVCLVNRLRPLLRNSVRRRIERELSTGTGQPSARADPADVERLGAELTVSVADAGEQGDYRRMMLLSLLGEMREGAEQEEGSTTFF